MRYSIFCLALLSLVWGCSDATAPPKPSTTTQKAASEKPALESKPQAAPSELNAAATAKNAAPAQPTLVGTWVLNQPTDDWMNPPFDGLTSTIVIEDGGKLTETSKSSYESERTFTVRYKKTSDKNLEVFQQTVKETNGNEVVIEPYQITWIDADTMETSIDTTKLRYERRPRTTPAFKGTYIGIWKFKNPNERIINFGEELLSQTLEIEANGQFIFSFLTAGGTYHTLEGRWKKVAEKKLQLSPRNFNFDERKSFPGELLDAETFQIGFLSHKNQQLVRAKTVLPDYQATEAEKQKYVGVWQAKNPIPQYKSEIQTLNADGTAVFDMTFSYDGSEQKLPGTWKLVSADVIVITRQHVNRTGHFMNTAKLLDQDTLEIGGGAFKSIFSRKP